MPDGWCTMTNTDNSNNKHQLSFSVINNKQNSLLSMNTCFDLRLIKISETVHLVSEEPLENILMEYENVLQGIRCLYGEYELEVDPTWLAERHNQSTRISKEMMDISRRTSDTR